MEGLDPLVVLPLVALVLIVDVVALVDLRRRGVRTGPRWVWALLILASFPLGVILYATVGRRRPEDEPVRIAGPDALRDLPPPAPGDGGRAPRVVSGHPVVTTDDLRKVYGEVAAVDGVDLVVPRGAIYGLIGPNGAGKTTLLSMLTGLRRPTSGSIAVDVAAEAIAVLPDTPQFEPWLTAHEVVDLARVLQRPDLPSDRVDDALVRTGLGGVADRRVGGFSRGMLQRLGLAACLVTEPALLFLDEPSSALDPAGRREVLDLVGRISEETTVVLSTHILSDVQQICDVVGVLHRGTLRYQGPTADLLRRTTTAIDVHVRPPTDRLLTVLHAADCVTDIEVRAPGHVRVTVTDVAAGEAELPGLLAAAGARLVSVNPAADLETAFLELTGGDA